jgi:hypothetical protein
MCAGGVGLDDAVWEELSLLTALEGRNSGATALNLDVIREVGSRRSSMRCASLSDGVFHTYWYVLLDSLFRSSLLETTFIS